MNAISSKFADWVVQRITHAIPAEWRESVPVYNERELNFDQHIQQSVNKGLGACFAVSLPRISKEGDNSPGNTQYRLQLEVGLTHNAGLSPALNSQELAEVVFRAFVGAEYYSGGILAYDVAADNLTGTSTGVSQTHVFSVYFILTL